MKKKIPSLVELPLILAKIAGVGVIFQCIFLNLLFAEPVSAQNIYTVEIHLVVKDNTLKQIFTIIEGSTGFSFTYSSRKIKLDQQIDVRDDHKNLGALLDYIARETGLVFRQMNENILVKENEKGPCVEWNGERKNY